MLVTGRGGPYDCEALSHFLGNRLTDGGKVLALHTDSFLPPGGFLVLISVRV
jgi:hypothetical protein